MRANAATSCEIRPALVCLAFRFPSDGTALIPIRCLVHVGGTNDGMSHASRIISLTANFPVASVPADKNNGIFLMSNSALQIGRPHRSLCSKGILRPTARSYALNTLYDPLYSNFKLTCDVQYTLTELDRVKPAKVTLAQLGKQLSAFSTETMIITMFTSTPYANAPCPQLQESSPKTLLINDALILSFHLYPHLPTELLPTSFPM